MLGLRTPGVYYQPVDAGGLPVTPLRTDIAGFVGLAERGPVGTPVPVESWHQFVTWFGGFTPSALLAYAVRAFFENGGRRCWIVRVASDDPAVGAEPAGADVGSTLGPVWRVRASSPGVWGNALTFTMRERNRAQTFAPSSDVDGHWSTVDNVSGLARGVHVRLRQQETATTAWRVVSKVDAVAARVWWMHPDGGPRLPTDRPLVGFDPSARILVESVDYTLAVSEAGRLIRLYEGLTIVAGQPQYGPTALPPLAVAVDFGSGRTLPNPPEPVVIEELRTDLTHVTGLDVDPFATVTVEGGRDGAAALAVADFIGDGRGLRALEDVNEVAVLAVPDAQPRPLLLHPFAPPPPCEPDPCVDPPLPAPIPPRPVPELPPGFGEDELYLIQAEQLLQCERRRDRFALLDPPFDAAHGDLAGIREVLDWRARFDSKFGALYFPWLRVVDPLRPGSGELRSIPPCGHVAGRIAWTDLNVGVHRAPANQPLEWVHDGSLALSDERHGDLNWSGVNAIREAGGRGLRILGARTVSSDPDWRYVNVRRLMSMIEEALEVALQWAVFEPNNFMTRARTTMAVTIFLEGLHETGMLAGRTPEESFYVRCDLENNPASERDLGRLLVEIGIAPAKPLEFVVVRVGRAEGTVEVAEVTGTFSVAGVGG